MKFVKLALVLAMALCLTASVYAETQSVKVSGDLAVRGFARSNYDYRSVVPESGPVTRTGFMSDETNLAGAMTVPGTNQTWWMSTAEIQVDAELTDNVSTVIRVANERDWDVQTKNINVATTVAPNGLGGYTSNANEYDVGLDLAYLTLKNFIYSPLSVTIGRQDLWIGKGFIVGSNHLFNNWQNANRINAPEYTTFTAFDSIKATLDYDPWAITGIYSKIFENAIGDDDDVNLWGLNVGYKFDNYKAEAEAYWFFKADNSFETWTNVKGGNNDVQTIGARGSFDPIDTVTLAGEAAYQFGSYVGDRMQVRAMDRSAWALDFSAEWRGLMDKCAWKPKLGAEYIYYSGDEQTTNNTVGIGGGASSKSGVYTGWDPMFRGKFDSAIREFVGSYYGTYDYRANPTGVPTTGDASFTNQNQIIFSGSVQPIESVTLKGNVNLFWTAQPFISNVPSMFTNTPGGGDVTRKGYIGTEYDFQALWDYTEDVSFGLLAAWFVPGKTVYQDSDAVASDLVATVKVGF